jgi:biopolymer transport protein ExbB
LRLLKYHAQSFQQGGAKRTMWEIIRAGGLFMWPIVLCSVIAAAIILERLWTLQSSRVIPTDLADKVYKWAESDQITDKLIVALEQNSPLGRLLAVGLTNRNRPRALMIERLEDTGRHVVHDLERFLNTLGTIAAVSPLLGLLGTVTGIIHAFSAITAQGIGDPQVLSGGIGEALITTAAGLTVAIPALVVYRFLRGKVERLVVRMEKEAMKLVDAIDLRARLARGDPA